MNKDDNFMFELPFLLGGTNHPKAGDPEFAGELARTATTTEPDNRGNPYSPNMEYSDGDGIHVWSFRTDSLGNVKDTIKHKPDGGYDTIQVKRYFLLYWFHNRLTIKFN